MNFRLKFEEYKSEFESFLFDYVSKLEYPKQLKEAVIYALNGLGKRVRPVLFLSVCKEYNKCDESALLFSCAIEILHNYSLIHDDLPSIDNDEYRRGRLTVHKVYGEALALLAGDTLLNLAYETIALAIEKSCDKPAYIKAFSLFSTLTGGSGLIGGQVVDIDANKQLSKDTLDYIYYNKTGAMFALSLGCASIICATDYEKSIKLGYDIGYIFQLGDDILDNDTSFSIKNLYDSVEINDLLGKKVESALISCVEYKNFEFLKGFIEYISSRKNWVSY